MPVIGSTEATTFETHGSRFSSYVAPSRGSSELCAWRLDVPADLDGVAHRPNREEILLVLDGELRITLDGVHTELHRGDVALVRGKQRATRRRRPPWSICVGDHDPRPRSSHGRWVPNHPSLGSMIRRSSAGWAFARRLANMYERGRSVP